MPMTVLTISSVAMLMMTVMTSMRTRMVMTMMIVMIMMMMTTMTMASFVLQKSVMFDASRRCHWIRLAKLQIFGVLNSLRS